MTSFVGRRQEVADVRRLLSAARLVTLTGPAGVGKTRLAMQVAKNLRRAFPDGVWLVKLAELRDESRVASAIAACLEAHDRTAREPAAILRDNLASKRLLLVIDNCEHLREVCGPLVASLLAASPGLRVLATGREPLATPGEHIWPVPPMTLPTDLDIAVGTAHQSDAMKLFEDRAAAVQPGFKLTCENERAVSRLCRRLDGLPLAIELATALVRSLSVDRVLEHLEDRSRLFAVSGQTDGARHQTLRASIAWSFDRCTRQEKALWAELPVFPGEFDIDAAEQICGGDGLAPDEVFTAVTGLVDKSILTREDHGSHVRYRMLATLREFGEDRLDEAVTDATTLRRRHRDYYLNLVEQADASWFGPKQTELVGNMRLDLPNLWSALDLCLSEPDEARAGLRMAGGLWFFWSTNGCPSDGRGWLRRALELDPTPTPERTKALWANAYLAIQQGDMRSARPLVEECERLTRQLDDRAMTAHAVQLTAYAELLSNNLDRAVTMLERTLEWERDVPQPNPHLATNLFRLALARCLTGDLESSLTLCKECEALCDAQGDHWTRACVLWVLGVIRWTQGDLDQMTTHLHECLRTERPINDPLNVANCIEFLAWAAAATGQPARVAELLGSSHKLWNPLGEYLFGFQRYMDWHAECVTRARRELGDQAFDAAFRRGRQRGLDETIGAELDEPSPHAGDSKPNSILTHRELEVAKLVGQGLSNREIATVLMISQRTAESHIEHILTKLGFNSRARVASWVYEQRDD